MISYNDFTNFNKTNYNFSVCDDWGWFYMDEEDPLLQNAIIHLHRTSPPVPPPIKSSLKNTPPVVNPLFQMSLNIVQKMPHVRVNIDKVYPSSVSYKNNRWDPVSSFNAIKNGLVFGVVLMIYILSP
jgi:hypothetical protein